MTIWKQFAAETRHEDPETLWRGYSEAEWERIGQIVDDSFPDILSTPLALRWKKESGEDEEDEEVNDVDVRRGIAYGIAAWTWNFACGRVLSPKKLPVADESTALQKIVDLSDRLQAALSQPAVGRLSEIVDLDSLGELSKKARHGLDHTTSRARRGRPRESLRNIYWRNLVRVWRDELGAIGSGRGQSTDNVPDSRLNRFLQACSVPVMGEIDASSHRIDSFLRQPRVRNNSDELG